MKYDPYVIRMVPSGDKYCICIECNRLITDMFGFMVVPGFEICVSDGHARCLKCYDSVLGRD